MTSPKSVASGSVVAGRYEIQQELARGGMGIVYRALDRRSERLIAVKRSLGSTEGVHKDRLRKEYQTLVTLRHPHIIQVYDYGVDELGPYYTMELLDGADLRTLSPLAWQTACACLRDVASSLALLHSRRLLHSDVGAANVRLTGQGRAKLIDFGTLTSFGKAPLVAGTPPGTPPEVLDGLDLDQRVDLYGLGATAYFALAGRHAYPVSAMTLLPTVWERGPPPPPSHFAAQVPAELDELVMSLLDLDRSARPHSAAEVIDRLDAIAGLPRDRDDRAARSYMLGTGLVARDSERGVLLERMHAALSGQGGAVLIAGERGLGKSALLDELLGEAKVTGAQVLSVEVPISPAPLATWAGVLAAMHDAGLLATVTPIDRTPQQMAVALSNAGRVVIALENVERADEESLLAWADFVEASRQHPIFLVATAALEGAGRGLRALRDRSLLLELEPFDTAATQAFVERLFGSAAAAPRLSAYLCERADGNPRAHAQIIAHLIEGGSIRYVEGEWVLPHDLPAHDKQIDALLDAAFERRFVTWSTPLRALAQCLSPHRRPFDLDLCRALTAQETELVDQPLEPMLLELVREGVLSRGAEGYAFARPRVRELLYARLDEERRKRQHLCLARALELRDRGHERGFELGFHFILAGDAKAARRHINQNLHTSLVDADKLVAAVDDLWTLLDHQRQEGATDDELALNEGVLVVSGYYVDPTVHDRLGHRALAHLHEITGFALASRLSRWLGSNLAVLAGVLAAWIRRLVRKPNLFSGTFLDGLLTFIGACSSMSAVACFRLDFKVHPQLLGFLSVARGLSRYNGLRLVYDLIHVAALIVRGRFAEAHAGLEDQLVRLKKVPFFHEQARHHYEAGLHFFIGRSLLLRGGEGALRAAERIEALGATQDLVMAQFLRRTHFLYQGHLDAVRREEQSLDDLSARHGARWIADMLRVLEFLPYHLSKDVLGLKQTLHRIERLLTVAPGLAVHRRVIEAMYEGHRGRPDIALSIYEDIEAQLSPFSDPVWAAARAHQAECLNALQRPAEALALCTAALSHLSEAARDYVFAYQQLDREAAMALSALGRPAEAAARLDALLAVCTEDKSPLLCGLLHFDRARVARIAVDQETFDRNAHAACAMFQKIGNPALLARARRLSKAFRGSEMPSILPPGGETPSQEALLRDALGPDLLKRAGDTFSRIVEVCQPRSAELHIVVFGKAVSCARLGEPPRSLQSQVVSIVNGESPPATETEELPKDLIMVPLKAVGGQGHEIVGVLTLSGCPQPDAVRSSPLLSTLALELSEAEEVTVLG